MTVAPLPVGADGQTVPMNRGAWAVSPAVSAPVVLALSSLTDDEEAAVSRLSTRILGDDRFQLEMSDAYYRGEHRISDLGISMPPQMRNLRIALGWPRVAVDAVHERLDVDGFRFPSAPDIDEGLQEIWLANDMDSESPLATLDAMVFGRGFVAAGTNPESGMPPLLTVESPLDLAAEWDPRTRKITHALRVHGEENARLATLYTPDANISLQQVTGGWAVYDRDDHKLGRCLVTQLANQPRSYYRRGMSDITPEIRSITDDACRTLLGQAVAREFYGAPQRYILGADESAFQDANGNTKSGWETYLGRVLALERDEDGNVPTVGQFTAYNPAVYTQILDMYARIMSSITGLPPHVLGYTTDNPASADAIRSSEMRLKLKADRKARLFGAGWREAMKLAILVRDKKLPDEAGLLQTVWKDTGTPTPAETTDAITKQVAAGILPAASDVTLEHLGYSAQERERITADRAHDQGASLLAELSKSIQAKEARVDTTIATDINGPAVKSVPPVAGPGAGEPPSVPGK